MHIGHRGMEKPKDYQQKRTKKGLEPRTGRREEREKERVRRAGRKGREDKEVAEVQQRQPVITPSFLRLSLLKASCLHTHVCSLTQSCLTL